MTKVNKYVKNASLVKLKIMKLKINKGSLDSKSFGPNVTILLLSANMMWPLFAVSIVICIVGSKYDCICDYLKDLLSTELIITQNV